MIHFAIGVLVVGSWFFAAVMRGLAPLVMLLHGAILLWLGMMMLREALLSAAD